MELKVLIFLFITLPYINCGDERPYTYAKDVRKLDNYKGKKIVNNILILNQNGFMSEREKTFVYAGMFVKDDGSKVPVAIEFIPKEHIEVAVEELKIFEKLKAHNNSQIEELGIPNVYYEGAWNKYHLIAMTKLDKSLYDIKREGKIIYPLDIMILFKNFVIQTEHMHTKGIFHGRVDSKRIMFRSSQSFITDFHKSREMDDMNKFELTRQDWKDFLLMISNEIRKYGITIYWGNWRATKEELQQHELNGGLKTVIKEFGDEAFAEDDSDGELNDFPNYNHLEEIINIEINKSPGNSGSPPKFSWLPN